ncbi:SEL1-like repeat protein [Candidatus Odyssella thessalonicensis]|uniref:SEL1-like repeat protein n=1 Tax=Candidatus Odyssella thessalonicensis TaxID=84647 RepID=UPI000225AC3B|nr:SEL1-like repeat protein [Candidatus Odyssella thessalonicensis]
MKRIFYSLYSSASVFAMSLTFAAAMDAPIQASSGKRPYEATQAQVPGQVETDTPEVKRQRLNSLSVEELHTEAEAGNPEAQLELALIYKQGKGVLKDPAVAVE